jgi:hypothetical protein
VDSVFIYHLAKQITATEVNGDDIPLTVADVQYMWGILYETYERDPLIPPPSITTAFTIENGVVSIDSAVAAAFIVVNGNVTPSLLASNMRMWFFFNGENTNIVIAQPGDSGMVLETFSGPFLNIGSQWIVSAEFATVQGGVVHAQYSSQPFKISIEKTHGTVQGEHEFVDVRIDNASLPMGGFDFLISYTSSPVLTLTDITPSDSLFAGGCDWEYFTYAHSVFGSCGSACATDKVRVIGIADVNNGNQHPSCFALSPAPASLFTMDFFVSDNPLYECQFVPINFVWFDCSNNTITDKNGDSLFLSRYVRPYDNNNIADSTDSYPTFKGAQICAASNLPRRVRYIDFFGGGVDILCTDTVADRGDVNLNEIPNEIADLILFSNYFLYSLSVFSVNESRQIGATDINVDGIFLGVADLIYLTGVVKGIYDPYPNPAISHSPAIIEVTYTVANGQISIDSAVAGAFVVVDGNVEPEVLVQNVAFSYHFNGTNTHILISPLIDTASSIHSFNGTFLNVGSNEVISAEFGTALGERVNATRVDGK